MLKQERTGYHKEQPMRFGFTWPDEIIAGSKALMIHGSNHIESASYYPGNTGAIKQNN